MQHEILAISRVEDALTTTLIGRPQSGRNELHDAIDSTNNRAAALAREGAAAGTLILARQQTAGRGRQGRVWSSPPDAGISMSVLLRPRIALARLPLITLATGAACAKAVESVCGIRLELKWVNDLTAGGKKVGGILAEMPGQALVIGIGMNVRLDLETLPDELKERVDWLERLSGSACDPNTLVAAIAASLEKEYLALENGDDKGIIERWKKYSVTLGKRVTAALPQGDLSGVAVDLTSTGALVIITDTGERLELSAGEITIRMADGSYC